MIDFQQKVADVLMGRSGFEGTVYWPYLDTHIPPLVTVGTGCAIPLVEAVTLPFTINGRPAEPQEITDHYNRVLGMLPGKYASFYSYPGCLMLSDQACMDLLQKRFDAFTVSLRRIFPSFDDFPVAIKAALLEMIYGLGQAGMMKYKKLIAAVNRGDWKMAAAESAVNASDPAYARRNAWVAQQFLSALEGTCPS